MSTLAKNRTNPAASLSQRMRTESRDAHLAAESSRFITELLAGALPQEAYGDYLLHLVGIYQELESFATLHANHPAVAAVADQALFRAGAIADDLDFWVGADWPTHQTSVSSDSPAVQNYRARIADCANNPEMFVAHHYTRYLGDLAGGQAIGRAVSQQYHVPPGVGVAFYRFDQIDRVKPYRDDYRGRLDALGLSPQIAEAVAAEVRAAFGLNQALFIELAVRHCGR